MSEFLFQLLENALDFEFKFLQRVVSRFDSNFAFCRVLMLLIE